NMEPHEIGARGRHPAQAELNGEHGRKCKQDQAELQAAADMPKRDKGGEARGKRRGDDKDTVRHVRGACPGDARQHATGKEGLQEDGDDEQDADRPPPRAGARRLRRKRMIELDGHASPPQSYLTSWISNPSGCFRKEVYMRAKSRRCGVSLTRMPASASTW